MSCTRTLIASRVSRGVYSSRVPQWRMRGGALPLSGAGEVALAGAQGVISARGRPLRQLHAVRTFLRYSTVPTGGRRHGFQKK